MSHKTLILLILLFSQFIVIVAQQKITLDDAVHQLAIMSSHAKSERLLYENDILRSSNYKKSFLPSLEFNFNPINFNRSIKALQQANDGGYNYIEDYSNNSSIGLSINQKIGLTGGRVTVGSRLNYLNEFSRKRHSFSSTPFSVGYSQSIIGGKRKYILEKKQETLKEKLALKRYCTNIAGIQQKVLSLYLNVFYSKLEMEMSENTRLLNDSLLYIGRVKYERGVITEYDYKQIELQSINMEYSQERSSKNYREALLHFVKYLNIEVNSVEIVTPKFDLPLLLNEEKVITYINKNNPFFLERERKSLEADKSLLQSKLSNSFNGNISLDYGVNQYADNFFDAYIKPNSRQSVIISFQIPIFRWGINSNNVKIAENIFKVNELSQQKEKNDFEVKMKSKVNSYNHAVNMWLISERSYNLVQEQLLLITQKFNYGKISVYEVINIQKEQDSAMRRYYDAIREVYQIYFELRSLALYDFKSEKELQSIFIESVN